MVNQFVEFIDHLKQIGLEYYGKYYSVYPAVVEDNNDPEKRGRIKISLPSILEEGEVVSNWCDPCGQAIAGDKSGEFMPPYEGDVVDVIFENGDLNYPKYVGGFWADGELPDDFSSGYGDSGPAVRGWVFKSGQKILIDETSGKEKITVFNTDKSSIVIDADAESMVLSTGGGHKFSLIDKSDTQSVAVETSGGNKFTLDDKNQAVSVETSGGHKLNLDDKGTKVSAESSGGHKLTMDDGGGSVKLESSGGDSLTMDSSGVDIKESSGASMKLSSGKIAIGGPAAELADLLDQTLQAIQALTVPTILGPSGPPINLPQFVKAQALLDTIKGTL